MRDNVGPPVGPPVDEQRRLMPEGAAPDIGRRALAPILAVQFIGTLGYSIAIPFLVFLVTDFGGAPWTYGVVGATYSAAQFVGAPLLGRWSDRTGRPKVLLVSQAGTLLAWLLFGIALTLPLHEIGTFAGTTFTLPLLLIFAARAVDGLTGGNVSVASAYVADVTQGQASLRRVAFGRMAMAASLGFAIGPAAAGLLGSTAWGYGAPVIAAAAISAVATGLVLTLREPKRKCPEGPPPQPAVTRVLGHQHRRCDKVVPEARVLQKRRPIVTALLLATFVLFLAFNLFYAGFPVHAAQRLKWDAGDMGLFFALMSAMMIVAQGPLLKMVSERLPSAAVFGIGMLGLIGAFVAFAFEHRPVVFLGAALFAVGNGLSWPTFQARLADVAGEAEQGAVQGAAASAGSLASIVGLVVGGVFYSSLQANLFVAGAVLFAIVAAGTPIWFRPPITASRPP